MADNRSPRSSLARPRFRSTFSKGRHSKRSGISTVVETLLIVAITVTLGTFAFAFASGGLGTMSQSFANWITSSGNSISEKFVVEQVTFTTTGGTQGADVYVRNVGAAPTTLVSVYIFDQSSNTFVSQTAISTTVNVGAFVNIDHTTLTFTPSHGHTYSFTLTSSLGNSVPFYAKAA
jgi:hypothetical protein